MNPHWLPPKGIEGRNRLRRRFLSGTADCLCQPGPAGQSHPCIRGQRRGDQGKQQLDTTEEIQFEFMEVATAMDHIRGGRFQNALLVASLMMALSEQFQDSPPVS